MAERKRTAATTMKRITRGPRKGQVIEVYAKSGTEVRRGDVATGERRTNRSKKNPRAGKKFDVSIDDQGREVHTYAGGKSVTLKGKRHSAVRTAKSKRYEDGSRGLTIAQRQAAVRKANAKPKKRTAPKRRAKSR